MQQNLVFFYFFPPWGRCLCHRFGWSIWNYHFFVGSWILVISYGLSSYFIQWPKAAWWVNGFSLAEKKFLPGDDWGEASSLVLYIQHVLNIKYMQGTIQGPGGVGIEGPYSGKVDHPRRDSQVINMMTNVSKLQTLCYRNARRGMRNGNEEFDQGKILQGHDTCI